MIIAGARYTVISKNSNVDYFGRTGYPDWTMLNTLVHIPDQLIGYGVEPHYHDGDEFWLFYAGYGEVWLDDERYEITPNTVVYTPMGTVHRFHMFTDFGTVSAVTRLERLERAAHLWVAEDIPMPPDVASSMPHLPKGMSPAYRYAGPPDPTVSGFVVPGIANTGPFVAPGPRCPLSELRMVTFAAGKLSAPIGFQATSIGLCWRGASPCGWMTTNRS